jgi:hypothetical protein
VIPVEEELSVVCQSIAEDGELSSKEVHYLAEWLAANPESRQTAVGSRLTATLNEILADGEINESELHRLAPLIGEAIAVQYSSTRSEPTQLPQAAIAPPPLPKIGFVAGVKNWLASRKEKKQQEEFARRELERRRISARHKYIHETIQGLRDATGFLDGDGRFLQKADEEICWIEPGVLHEIKVVRRRYVGGTSSTRIRIAKGISFSIGGSRGELVSERGLVPISTGNLIVTTKRLAFVGDRKSFAVKFDKLIDIQIAINGLQFSETNKQHSKLIRFDSQNGDVIVAIVNFLFND